MTTSIDETTPPAPLTTRKRQFAVDDYVDASFLVRNHSHAGRTVSLNGR